MIQELILANNWKQNKLQFTTRMPKLTRNKKHHQAIRFGLTPISRTEALFQKNTFVRSEYSRSPRASSVNQKKIDFPDCNLSVEQIKTKIQQFLNNNGQISAINFGSLVQQQLPQNKGHFRMNLFKSNEKKRMQLRNQVHQQFSISETFISHKKPISSQNVQKKDKINLNYSARPQEISFSLKLTDMKRRSVGQRQKCLISKKQHNLQQIELPVQPWRGMQLGEIQDLPHWSQRE